jgi:hypothetical protein
MTEWILDILQLPDACLVDKKITKVFFTRNFELTNIEKAMLDDFQVVVSINWIASIKPDNSNIPAITDIDFTFEEIQVIAVQTTTKSFDKYKLKLAEFVQKYIPYHILLVVYCDTKAIFNTCTKRINANDSNKRVIEKMLSTEDILSENLSPEDIAFIDSLKFFNQGKANLKVLYDSYFQKLVALQTAEIKGEFAPRTSERSMQDVALMGQIDQLKTEIMQLQRTAKRETQMNKRVELNTIIHSKKQQIESLKKLITAT